MIESSTMNLSILHLSDLHIGSDIDAERWFSQLADDLKNELGCMRLDVLIISGDVSDKSEPDEYKAAGTFINKLRAYP